MEILKDGTGKGYTVKVDSENRLWTYSITRNESAFQSEYIGKTFMVYAKRDFVAGGVNESIMDFKYTGNDSCHINNIIITTNSDIAKAELFVESTNPSGGFTRIPVNLNLASGRSSETVVLTGESDLIATVLDAKEILDVRLSKDGSPTVQINFDGALVLGKDNTIHILGEVNNAGDKMRVSVYFYEEEDK